MAIGNSDRGGGGGGGRDGAGRDPDSSRKDDCHTFANMVEQLANASQNVQDFMGKMASTFTGAKDSSINAMREGANKLPPPQTRGFRDTGFQPQFRDGSNQVRHFTAGLVAGYDLGEFPALIFMNHREHEGVDDADIALNAVSTYAGQLLADSNVTPEVQARYGLLGMDYHDLANFIRDKVCQH